MVMAIGMEGLNLDSESETESDAVNPEIVEEQKKQKQSRINYSFHSQKKIFFESLTFLDCSLYRIGPYRLYGMRTVNTNRLRVSLGISCSWQISGLNSRRIHRNVLL